MSTNDLQQIAEIFLSEDAIEVDLHYNSLLVGRCVTKATPCPYLHAYRYLGDGRSLKSRRQHDFNRGANHKLVWQAKYQNLSPVLLFRLSPFKLQNVKRAAIEKSPTSTPVDLICPSLICNEQFDIGHLENFLYSNGFRIEKVLLLTEDKHFHRWRISLSDDQRKDVVLDKFFYSLVSSKRRKLAPLE